MTSEARTRARRLVEDYFAFAGKLAAHFARPYPWLADDLRSDALLALWRAAGDFDPGRVGSRGTPIAFASYAAHRVNLALCRRLAVERRTNRAAFAGARAGPVKDEDGFEVEAIDRLPGREGDPADAAAAPEEAAAEADLGRVVAAVAARLLTPAEQAVLRMRAAGGTYRDIAAATGLGVRAARACFRRAAGMVRDRVLAGGCVTPWEGLDDGAPGAAGREPAVAVA